MAHLVSLWTQSTSKGLSLQQSRLNHRLPCFKTCQRTFSKNFFKGICYCSAVRGKMRGEKQVFNIHLVKFPKIMNAKSSQKLALLAW